MEHYMDLHTHTTLSDGSLTPQALVEKAYDEEIRHIALTDHNKLHADIEQLRALHTDMEIISASEISAEWFTLSGEKKEIHVIGLFLDQMDALNDFLKINCDNGVTRFDKMLEALESLGITFAGCRTCSDFRARYYPDRSFIGRMQLAQIAVREGYASSIDQFMNEYIGDRGLKKAYVPSDHIFAPLAEVISIIHKASGTAVLAHPMSYRLSDTEVMNLIDHFACAGGDGMECYYSHYSDDICGMLTQLAKEKCLLISCASDFHGNRGPEEHLGHYSVKYLNALRERHLLYARSSGRM